ncbi:MAG: hypothetical protein GY915_00900 [bacterium]|nr:hypothetical protein [bacterium]
MRERAAATSFPVSFQFRNSEGQEFLRYIAASHVAGKPEDGDTHPTYEMIAQAFEELQPDFVIAEGFAPEHIEGIRSFCQDAQGESNYAVRLSVANNIPFTGGEPSEDRMIEALQEFAYNATDYMCGTLIDITAQRWREKEATIRSPSSCNLL